MRYYAYSFYGHYSFLWQTIRYELQYFDWYEICGSAVHYKGAYIEYLVNEYLLSVLVDLFWTNWHMFLKNIKYIYDIGTGVDFIRISRSV